ncbi:MAG: phosphatidylserine decarboxylase family protein [Pseudomonadota bacterium]
MDKFPLALSGLAYILATAFLAGVASALGVRVLAWPLWIVTAWMVWFFRDPARASQAGPEAVIAPADGKVVAVQEVACPELPQGRACLVSIFMNIFDVHVNRLPVSGRVLSVAHQAGDFDPADQPQTSRGNERQEIVLLSDRGYSLMVVQVAGLVARRIECWLSPNQMMPRGQRFGMIRFGSRVDVYLPLEAQVLVGLGQRVKAGETVIGAL